MPTYDYICSDCGYEFEHFQSMSDETMKICPNCNGKLKRKISGGTGLIFKGSGYYLTDYVKKSSPPQQNKNIKKDKNVSTDKKTKDKND